MKNLRYYTFILLIITLGAFLRFFMLADKSLWLDEGASIDFSTGSNFQEIISEILESESGDRFQPLYYLVLFYWRQVFGDTEFALRSLSAFLGVGTVVVLFCTVLQVYGKKHALWSALLLSASSYGVYYSQQTRAYALLLFLAALQLYFFSKALNEGKARNEVISRCFFWLVTAFGLFCSIFIGIFTLSLCVSYILVYKNLRRWLQWWVPTALFCLPAILFYLASPVATDPTKVVITFSRQPIIQNIIFVFYGLLVGETYGPPIESLRGENKLQVLFNYLPQLLILLLVAAMTFILLVKAISLPPRIDNKKYQNANYFFTSVFVISFLLATLFAVVTKINWLPRHSFYMYIPLFVLIPLIVTKNYRKRLSHQALSRYAPAVIVALAVLNLYSISNYYFAQNYQRENYRLAAHYLLENCKPSVECVLLYGYPNLLRYYGDTLTLNGLGLQTNNLAEEVRSLTNNVETVIIAISYQSFWEDKNNFLVEKAMSELYRLKSQVSFTNFNFYHFVRKRE